MYLLRTVISYSDFKILIALTFTMLLRNTVCYSQDLEQIDLKHPFEFSGAIHLQMQLYNANNIEPRSKDFTYVLSGSPLLTVAGVSMPFSFTLSNNNNSFYQPFNQFGISPKYKWATLHLGYRNVFFSPYTLAGHTILGVGAELNPGKLRFGFMMGRVTRETDGFNYLISDSVKYYKRKGLGIKLGVGDADKFIDLSFFRAVDDTNSISDPLEFVSGAPEANASLGLSWKLPLGKNISWNTDAGVSLFTRDMLALQPEFDSTTEKTFQKLNFLLPVNFSSQAYAATKTTFLYQQKTYNLKLTGEYIMPDYKSLGAYYFTTDLFKIAIGGGFKFWENKIVMQIETGIQHNNLDNTEKNTTNQFSGTFNISVNPDPMWGFDIGATNFSSIQKPTITATLDTLGFSQVQQQAHVNFRYIIIGKSWTQAILPFYQYQRIQELYDNSIADVATDMHLFNLSYSLIYNSIGLSITPAFNFLKFINPYLNNTSTGFAITVSKPFLENTLTPSLNLNYNAGSIANIFVTTLMANVRVYKKHNIQLSVNYINNTDNNEAQNNYSETRASIGYAYSF